MQNNPRYLPLEYAAMRAYYARPVPVTCSCRAKRRYRGVTTPAYKCDYHVNAEMFAAIREYDLKIKSLMGKI